MKVRISRDIIIEEGKYPRITEEEIKKIVNELIDDFIETRIDQKLDYTEWEKSLEDKETVR